ncbi:MAG: class I SAM-dependent methyltransferase [bacterium]|nr:class I SAM-dependent methyltransferase [bacterium]MDZ4285992.1 class I SAM-dependent methyltransferase [Candidatus Sungbacteria bacterium]
MDHQAPSENTNSVADPVRIVSSLGLANGDFVADFGSGHGYFVIPLAQSVAPNGKVFAIDIQREKLEVTRVKAKLEHLYNIEYIQGDLEQIQGSKLKNERADLVIITNILHQAEHKKQIIKEAQRILSTHGRLAIIEWQAEETSGFGPPRDMRIAKETAMNLCTAESFLFEKEFDAGSHHYGMLFIKKL